MGDTREKRKKSDERKEKKEQKKRGRKGSNPIWPNLDPNLDPQSRKQTHPNPFLELTSCLVLFPPISLNPMTIDPDCRPPPPLLFFLSQSWRHRHFPGRSSSNSCHCLSSLFLCRLRPVNNNSNYFLPRASLPRFPLAASIVPLQISSIAPSPTFFSEISPLWTTTLASCCSPTSTETDDNSHSVACDAFVRSQCSWLQPLLLLTAITKTTHDLPSTSGCIVGIWAFMWMSKISFLSCEFIS